MIFLPGTFGSKVSADTIQMMSMTKWTVTQMKVLSALVMSLERNHREKSVQYLDYHPHPQYTNNKLLLLYNLLVPITGYSLCKMRVIRKNGMQAYYQNVRL